MLFTKFQFLLLAVLLLTVTSYIVVFLSADTKLQPSGVKDGSQHGLPETAVPVIAT